MPAPPLTSPESAGMSKAAFERIETHLRQRYIETGRFPGTQLMIYRRDQLVHNSVQGLADIERKLAVKDDTIFRIYSMTKPLTSTAIMMLYEEGRFQLDDPISRFLPAFRNMRVYAGGSRGKIDTVPAEREITFRDLLTHTSGLTYGFMESTIIDALYRGKDGIDFQTANTSLAELVDKLKNEAGVL